MRSLLRPRPLLPPLAWYNFLMATTTVVAYESESIVEALDYYPFGGLH
jgi:hypothetical protein